VARKVGNKQIVDALRALPAATRADLLAWIERRDRELRQQLLDELEDMILHGQQQPRIYDAGQPASLPTLERR
jgi:hypothetical protein